MARIFHRRPRSAPPQPGAKSAHWFGAGGVALALPGWGLILHEMARTGVRLHGHSFLQVIGTMFLATAVALSIVGMTRRSWAGWLGLFLSVGPALLLVLWWVGVLLIWLLVQASGTPGA